MLRALFCLQSGWSGQDLGSQFLFCDMCQASRGMGKRFTVYAFRHSYGFETAHVPCFRVLILPVQYHCCNSKVQTHSWIHKFTICDEVSTSQCEVTRAKASNKHDAEWQWVKWWRCGQADNSVDCDPNFAGATSSNEPHQMNQVNLNDIGRDLNLDSFAPGL